MKITNTTKWRTDDLRKLFNAALKAEGLTEREAAQYVDVSPSRKRVMGEATLRGCWVGMTVPNPAPGQECMSSEILDKFAQVFVHEIGHNAGLVHEEMAEWWEFSVPWTVGLEVRPKIQKSKAKRDLQAERREQAEKKLAEWEKKHARAVKRVKHWRAKVRYYERAAEKKAALKGQP